MSSITPKKIFFVSLSLEVAGAERVTTVLLNQINRKNYTPFLILFKKKGGFLQELGEDIRIFDLRKKYRWDFFFLIWRLRALIIKEKPDILFSSLEYPNLVTIIASLLAGVSCKVVLSEHSFHKENLKHERLGFVERFLMRLFYPFSDKIVAVSNGVKKGLMDDFLIKDEKIQVISNPVEIEKILCLSQEPVSHPFFEKSESKTVIISVGRLTKAKNYPMLFTSFAKLRTKLNAYLIVLGEGELKEELENLLLNLEMRDYVDLAGFQSNPFKWMKNADMFILSSSWEGFGNVIVEAMAVGVPVISTNCFFGPGEIIKDGENGLLVPVNDIESMTAAMERLGNDFLLRRRLVENARKNLGRFSADKVVSEYEETFG